MWIQRIEIAEKQEPRTHSIKTQIVRSPLPVANLILSSTASIQNMCWLRLIVSASECPNLIKFTHIPWVELLWSNYMSLPSLPCVLQLAHRKKQLPPIAWYVSVSSGPWWSRGQLPHEVVSRCTRTSRPKLSRSSHPGRTCHCCKLRPYYRTDSL